MAHQAVQWCSNFVAHVRKESGFGLIGELACLHRGDQLIGGLREQYEFMWGVTIPLNTASVTRDGTIGFQVENVMAAVAAVWGLALDWALVRQGLASFDNDSNNAQGRFNLFRYRGATVIADYGHNPDAMLALVRAVEAMPAKRRSVVISGAGDRRDEDIREQTRILGNAFDEVILYQDACQRRRADGEVLALLRQGLEGAQRTREMHEIHGEFVAIDLAMDKLCEGDLCLILVDQVEEALAHIAARVSQEQTAN